MKNKILIILFSSLLFACVLEVEYTLSDIKDAVVLKELEGNYLFVDDSAKVEFKLHDKKNIYDLYFKNENDSLVEHHKAFLSMINDMYFLNFSTINQLKSDEDKELYQFYKVQNKNDRRIQLLAVSDSLFEEKEFRSVKEFRDFFASNTENPAFFQNEKEDQIKLDKIN